MNTGLQDAHNLGCALADVLVGGMPERRLHRYEAERRPVARTLVATTDRLFGLVTADTALTRFIRGRAIPAMGPIVIRLLPRSSGARNCSASSRRRASGTGCRRRGRHAAGA